MIHNYMKPLSTVENNDINKTQDNPHEDNAFVIENLSHIFDKDTKHEYKIFDKFNLTIPNVNGKSEIVSIMGGSGCGKSCLLRMAAGLIKPQKGKIYISGKTIEEYKSVPMVFQSYSSYEWMTVLDNVALPLIINGVNKKEANERAMEIIKIVGLEQHATKYAKSSVLSGGQLQRVSIARCLASNSNVFFLDEATGALDIKMKREIQDLILNICYNSGIEKTIINVTHSVEEALYISDKIIILKPNPCTIVEEMNIDYGNNKRGRWIFDSDKYKEYSRHLNNILDKVCS